ncbi:MAG: transglycosylase domain-containing protein [Ardenticatenales bacterium]|nr:transglycosylase domain-containing protein [Ardenticatenales bacterium]
MKRRLLRLSLVLIVSLVAFLYWLLVDLPSVDQLALHEPSIQLLDRRGRLLYESTVGRAGRHQPVSLEAVPEALIWATVATEDRHFYEHPGVDLRGVLRAIWLNLRGREVVAGGSTITQQVARNLLLSTDERQEQTLRRKLREAVLAWRLTRTLSKDEILLLYLNQMNYGGQNYGVAAAAWSYFGKPVAELDLAEAALLAGLTQAPGLYDPLLAPDLAKARQEVVLELMVRAGYLEAALAAEAAREPLQYNPEPYPFAAPHLVEMALQEVEALLTNGVLTAEQGLVVGTTLDLDWQQSAEQIISWQLAELAADGDHRAGNAALVALEPGSGAVRALVGSADYGNEAIAGAVNMALTPRQPGSALKPFVYAASFDPDRPDPWSPGTVLPDVLTTFTTADGDPYVPVNFDRQEHGPVAIREALAASLNIPAVVALAHVGLPRFQALALDLGLSTLADPFDYDLAIVLGGGEVTLLELTGAYGSLANGGLATTPYVIETIRDADGQLLYSAPAAVSQRVMDERVAWQISDILADPYARTLSFGRYSILQIDRPAAVKTGTTNDFRDNWTVGYTAELVVGVWVGNADYTPMRDLTGVSGAGPIWHHFMRAALADWPPNVFRRPDGLVEVELCALSGLLPGPDCPYRRVEWLLPEQIPVRHDDYYPVAAADGPVAGGVAGLNLPMALQPWARQQDLLLSDLPAGGEVGDLRLTAPVPGSVYEISPELPLAAQQLRLAAGGVTAAGVLTFWVDGERVCELSSPPHECWWPLAAGAHRIWAKTELPTGVKAASPPIHIQVNPPP